MDKKILFFIFIVSYTIYSAVNQYSQTRSYLAVIGCCKIEKIIGAPLATYKNLLDDLSTEEERNQDYFALYHAQSKEAAAYRHLIDECNALSVITSSCIGSVRPNNQWYTEHASISDYLKTYTTINDTAWPHKTNLLCTNLSPIGHLRSDECTLRYFINGSSCVFPHSHVLNAVLTSYAVPYTEYLFSLITSLIYNAVQLRSDSKAGSLLQIFVHKKAINKYVYLSYDYGCPVTKELLLNQLVTQTIGTNTMCKGFNVTINRYTAVAPYIRLYRKHKEAVASYMPCLQARILLHEDFFTNKIDAFCKEYHLNSASTFTAYTMAIKKIAHLVTTLARMGLPINSFNDLPKDLQDYVKQHAV